jgi:hypothetical protein
LCASNAYRLNHVNEKVTKIILSQNAKVRRSEVMRLVNRRSKLIFQFETEIFVKKMILSLVTIFREDWRIFEDSKNCEPNERDHSKSEIAMRQLA